MSKWIRAALSWVRGNCKFAIDLTQAPANWESNDSAMRSMLPKPPPAVPPDMEAKVRQSIDNMQLALNETKQTWDYVDIPTGGGHMEPRMRSEKLYYLNGKVLIEGAVYYPDAVTMSWGPIDKYVKGDFSEFYPKELREIMSSFPDDKSVFRLLSAEKNADFYNVKIEGRIMATSSLEE